MPQTVCQPLECLALIPARGGSKRIPNKNIKPLAGHPLFAYTIGAALDSGVFKRVIVSTESPEIAAIAKQYGAEVPYLRPALLASDQSPDIEWIQELLSQLQAQGEGAPCFSILRPTSPFRTPQTIRRAWEAFTADGQADSLRAVEPCNEHPAKMWQMAGNRITPVIRNPDPTGTPWHSTPYQALPPIFVQNASLEIAWTRVVLEEGSIAGQTIMPFFSEGHEGFDINQPKDWVVAEYLLSQHQVSLPNVRICV
ncbi:acylneuraminate cytidylyltransferase family protein [Vampirovibrio sp.]|uniref:acylneuraminate cytidylyltransferase family protein n=1 Tax=Vampirovibrio sp. TaxID=2717857 RepID=UPI003592E97F